MVEKFPSRFATLVLCVSELKIEEESERFFARIAIVLIRCSPGLVYSLNEKARLHPELLHQSNVLIKMRCFSQMFDS